MARGGSKSIPKKNIKPMCGKPLIAYAIEASIKSDSAETWVSTDNDEIAEISREYGAKVIKRPEEIATDHSTSESALLHFAKEIKDFDIIIFLQATCPFVQDSDINNLPPCNPSLILDTVDCKNGRSSPSLPRA